MAILCHARRSLLRQSAETPRTWYAKQARGVCFAHIICAVSFSFGEDEIQVVERLLPGARHLLRVIRRGVKGVDVEVGVGADQPGVPMPGIFVFTAQPGEAIGRIGAEGLLLNGQIPVLRVADELDEL